MFNFRAIFCMRILNCANFLKSRKSRKLILPKISKNKVINEKSWTKNFVTYRWLIDYFLNFVCNQWLIYWLPIDYLLLIVFIMVSSVSYIWCNIRLSNDFFLYQKKAFYILYTVNLTLHNSDRPRPWLIWKRERQGYKLYHLCLNLGAVPSL